MHVILLGAPGSGKGTQAKLVSKRFGLPQISTGDILRAAASNWTPLGQKIKEIIDTGQLIPDDLMISIIKERIAQEDCQNGFILDGYPRTIPQADALNQSGITINVVLNINLKDEKLIERISGRRVHAESGRTYHTVYNKPKVKDIDNDTGEPLIQRSDDSEDTVRKRLDVFRKQTSPLIEYYKGDINVHFAQIDGSQLVEQISETIHKILESVKIADGKALTTKH